MANIRGAGGASRKYDVYVSFSKAAFESGKNVPIDGHMNHNGITKKEIDELIARPGAVADKDDRLTIPKDFIGKDGKEHVGSNTLYSHSQVEAMMEAANQVDAKGRTHTFEDNGRVYAAFKSQLIPSKNGLVINTQTLEPATKPFDSAKCLDSAKKGSAKLRDALNAKFPPKAAGKNEPTAEAEVEAETDEPSVGE